MVQACSAKAIQPADLRATHPCRRLAAVIAVSDNLELVIPVLDRFPASLPAASGLVKLTTPVPALKSPFPVKICLRGWRLLRTGPRTIGRDDFQFFWNFITAIQILPCVIETRRYGYIRDSGGRVETPHGATIGCEKSYNG